MRLRRIGREGLTLRRAQRGRSFTYLDADGNRVTDAQTIERLRGLGIPPAWREVRIAADPKAHIQANGTDVAGRLQYIYHPEWEKRRSKKKQAQLELLSAALPRIRRRVRQDLGAEAGSRLLAQAVGVALIDRTAMRVGRERYLDAHGTRGAGTLYARDAKVAGEVVVLSFPAKSGKLAKYRIADAALAEAIGRLQTVRGRRLLMYLGEDGKPRPLSTGQLLAYLRDIAGVAVTAKDFRTLHASAMAGEALSRLEPGASPTARKRQLAGVIKEVAAFLQNTPAICRSSYVAPCLMELFETGKLARLWEEGGSGGNSLKQREVRLAALLSGLG